MRFAAAFARDRDFAVSAPIAEPAAPAFHSPAPVALPGPRSRTDGAGGPRRPGARPGSAAQAARGRFTSLVPTTPSRDAVVGVTSHADAPATPSTSSASGLTADPPHNRPPSAGSGAARPADVPALAAVSPSALAAAPGTAATASSTALHPSPSPRIAGREGENATPIFNATTHTTTPQGGAK